MYFACMYENRIMKPTEIVLAKKGGEEVRENNEEGESNQDIL
jgi:hypothetical protein